MPGSNSNHTRDSERPKSPETVTISDVSDFIRGTVTNNLEYFCDQTNWYAYQIIDAIPHPFSKHPLFAMVYIPTQRLALD
jgi:hypothetical protein